MMDRPDVEIIYDADDAHSSHDFLNSPYVVFVQSEHVESGFVQHDNVTQFVFFEVPSMKQWDPECLDETASYCKHPDRSLLFGSPYLLHDPHYRKKPRVTSGEADTDHLGTPFETFGKPLFQILPVAVTGITILFSFSYPIGLVVRNLTWL